MPDLVPPSDPVAPEVPPDALGRVVGAGWLGGAHPGGFAVEHEDPSAAEAGRSAVVLLGPFGWEDVASHRSRLIWADQLARAGHLVLRVDLPATGDAAGEETDPSLLERWVATAAAALDEAAGRRPRTALVGLGLGGLVAALALADGASADDVVLWGVPSRGRSIVRQLQATAALQRSRIGGDDGLPEGWLEAGGFRLAPTTLAALRAVDLRGRPLVGARRLLLLGADAAPDDGIEGGTELRRSAAGEGYGAMVDHPERTTPPWATMALVGGFLAEAAPPVPGASSARRGGPGLAAELPLPGGGLERVVRLRPGGEELVGVLTVPGADGPPRAGLLLLNAGAVRRTGPNRLWVRFAREAAAAGVATLRLDLPGIGDADGDAFALRDVHAFYEVDRSREVAAALDVLAAAGAPRLVAGGLCAGGFHAFDAALREPRVDAVALLNPGALRWAATLPEQLQATKAGRLRSGAVRRRLLRGDVSWSAIRRTVSAVVAEHRRQPDEQAPVSEQVADALDALERRAVPVVLAFSGDEALRARLERDGVLEQAPRRWPHLELVDLPGVDHTLRPVPAQDAAASVVAATLERVAGSQAAAG